MPNTPHSSRGASRSICCPWGGVKARVPRVGKGRDAQADCLLRQGSSGRGPACALAPRQALAALRIEEMKFRRIRPQLCLLATLDLARGVEPGDDLLLALPRFRRARLLQAVGDHVGELVGLDPGRLDVEVGIEI